MKKTFFSMIAAATLLAACGGGGGGGETPVAQDPTQVPAEASASPQALVDWAGAQPPSETIEPLGMANFSPPTSETDEPAAVNR